MTKYSPTHYQKGKTQVWDFIADQQLDYFLGNVVKYICRAGSKPHESELDDLLKAKAYIEKRIALTPNVETQQPKQAPKALPEEPRVGSSAGINLRR